MVYRIVLLFSLLFCTCVRAQTGNGFTLESDKDGVSVWVRAEENGDMSVRVGTSARATVEDVKEVLDDAKRYPEWVHRCAEARTMTAHDGSDYLFISRIDMPFPFTDKVVVAGVKQWIDADGRLLRNIVAQPKAIPNENDEERLSVYRGEWVVTPDAANHSVQVSCTVRTDAGSGLPNWVRREILTGGPVKTMINLRKRLEEKAR